MSTREGATVAAAPPDWLAANQAHLAAALAVVVAEVERLGGTGAGSAAAPADRAHVEVRAELVATREAAAAAAPSPTALSTLVERFELTDTERDILLLCAAMDLVTGFAAHCERAGAGGAYPTFGLALAALPDAHWSAIAPGGPLRRFRLVEVGHGSSLATSPLRIEERILHFLAGVDAPEARLAGLLEPVDEQPPPTESAARAAAAVAAAWRTAAGRIPPVELVGPDASVARATAVAATAALGMTVQALAAAALPAEPAALEEVAATWEREALLRSCALLVEWPGRDAPDDVPARVRSFTNRLRAPVLVAADVVAGVRNAIVVDLEPAGFEERRSAWRAALGSAGESLNGELDTLAGQFRLSPGAIRRAARAADMGNGASPDRLWAAARREGRERLDQLAERLPGGASWDDLVLPSPQLATLREIAAQVRGRAIVDEQWGFARQGGRGLGISALFAGPSGTGKTLAAEVLGAELALDVYRIDLAGVVSKYIGETEKNLRRVFDAAETSGAILLFDEADALFGKRSEVRDSHDRYANIEVSYLLQRTESYRGLVVLTTNLKGAIDPAFLRRIRFVVQFPFPDAPERAAIWRRVFPPGAPLTGVDVDRLAALNLAGGSIRNIAVGAAFLAAGEKTAISMEHLLRAARTEYAKLERPLSDAETAGWA